MKASKTIYLAGSLRHQALLRPVAARVAALGWVVMSSWLWEKATSDEDCKNLRDRAIIDTVELQASSVVVRFPSLGVSRHGGRMAEVGMAIALNKIVIIVGGWENVFDHLPQVIHLKDEGELLEWLSAN